MPKKKAAPKVKVTYATCTVYATFDMMCPLCYMTVKANTRHECQKPE